MRYKRAVSVTKSSADLGLPSMRVRVFSISIPAMSTVGYATGLNCETECSVRFCADHRPMHDLGEALRDADSPIEVEVEEWQILSKHSGQAGEIA